MDWRTHILVGFVLGTAIFGIFWIQPVISIFALAFLAGISALLPDLDHDMSKGRSILNKLVPFAAFAAVSTNTCSTIECFFNAPKITNIVLISAALVGVYALFFTFLKPKHRGITHTVLFAALYGAVLYVLADATVAGAGFVGYFSHLLVDRHVRFF